MAKKVRSAMGVEVDFDSLKIKQQLAETPQSTEVRAREDYVEQRSNRAAARRAQQAAKRAAAEQKAAEESEVVEEHEVTDESQAALVDESQDLELKEPEVSEVDEPVATTRKQRRPTKK